MLKFNRENRNLVPLKMHLTLKSNKGELLTIKLNLKCGSRIKVTGICNNCD